MEVCKAKHRKIITLILHTVLIKDFFFHIYSLVKCVNIFHCSNIYSITTLALRISKINNEQRNNSRMCVSAPVNSHRCILFL